MNVLATIGTSALLVAFASALFAAGASIYGLRARHRAVALAGRRAIEVCAVLLTLAFIAMVYALLVNDFSIAHVASVSSTDMQWYMKGAALWSGQAGSLLFWTWMMSLFMAAFIRITVPKIPWGAPHAVATLGTVLGAFLVALVFFSPPFAVSPGPVADGQGLNPLLVDPGMLIHPPALLTGLISTVIPFTLGAAALMAGRLDGAWLRHARGWALACFIILSAGNILGGWWAYTVLGWGGYWGWDPVENSAILPLLPMTAFLHTLVVQERRGILKAWNLVLVVAAFALAVFGTFNVRSGLIASVHSFATSEVGPYFLALLGLTVVASMALMIWRIPRLHAESDYDSFASRETALMLNSYVLIAIALVVLGGTLFPVFSELFRDVRITVGPPFYNDVVGPLLIVLLALIAVGTVLPWRGASSSTLRRRFLAPTALLLAAGALLVAVGVRDPFATIGIATALTIIFVSLREYVAGTRGAAAVRGRWWPAAFGGLFNRDPQKYGGYLVHIGLAVMAIAVIGSTVYQQRVVAQVSPGESFEVAGYTLTFERLFGREPGVNGIELEAITRVRVERGDELVATLEPGRRFFTNFPDQPSAIVDVHTDWWNGVLPWQDVYLFTQGWDENSRAEIQAFVNPLVPWLWFGAIVYVLGGFLAFGPFRARASVTVEVPTVGSEQRV